MANAMKLANVDSSASIDIYSGELTGEFGFVVEEWTTQAAPEAEAAGTAELDDYELALPHEPVIETMTLVADVSGDSGLDNDDLRALMVSLQDMRRKAMEWRNDPLRAESIWWHWNIDGEADKRALVHRLEFSLREGFFSMLQGQSIVVDLTIVRHPYYEPVTSPTEVVSAGGSYVQTVAVAAAGDTNGRINSVEIEGSAGSGTSEIWMGIKPQGTGTSGFISLWEIEDGTEYTDATAGAVSGASGGDAVTISFATDDSLVKRSRVLMRDYATTNLNHNRGKYLWLLRYQAEGNGVGYHIRFNQTYLSDPAVQPLSEIYVAGESSPTWHIVPLGVASLPFGYGRDAIEENALYLWAGFIIEAARIGGTSGDDLILDTLIPIPLEHHLYVSQAIPTVTPGYTFVKTFENDDTMGYSTQGRSPVTGYVHPSPPAPQNWSTPPEGGLLVAAGTEVDATLTTITVRLQSIPRWALFNGA